MNEQPTPSPAIVAPKTKINASAVASLGLSILGMFFWYPLAVLGVICGVIAIIQISKSSSPVIGWAPAIVGLILSSAVALIGIYGWTLNRAHYQTVRSALCIVNVHQISLACATYADQHNGNLPRRLDELKPYVTSTKIFICPSAADTNRYSYEFVGLTNKWGEGSDLVVLREIEPRHGGKRTFLYDDGHVELRADSEL